MAKLKKRTLRAVYRVTGEKLLYLPELLHRKGVAVYFFKQVSETACLIEVDVNDNNKFFAICKNMCYNKLMVRYKGILSPVAYALKNVGVAVGFILFTILSALSTNVILSIKVIGSGSCFEEATKAVIKECNINKFTLFSSVDYDMLESAILVSNPRLSFVAVKKQGNALVVETILSSAEPPVLGSNTSDLLSSVDGVVEEITVLRGTPLIQAGQAVKKGDKLVGAYLVGKDDKPYETYLLARVKILQKTEYFYKCDAPTKYDISLAYALAEFYVGGEIVDKTHTIEQGGIKVIITIRYTEGNL